MKNVRPSLVIFIIVLTACVPQATATPMQAYLPAATQTPVPTANFGATLTPTPTLVPVQIQKLSLDVTCPHLVDAQVPNSGFLELTYLVQVLGGGDSSEEMPTGLFVHSFYEDLWIWDEETDVSTPLVSPTPSNALDVAVSSDHQKIAFWRDIETYKVSELWVSDAEGQYEQKLATFSISEIRSRNPDQNAESAYLYYGWIPNTYKVYYFVKTNEVYDSFAIFDVSTGKETSVHQAREAYNFTFAPDGSQLALITKPSSPLTGTDPNFGNLILVDTKDGNPQAVIPVQIRRRITYSPDGNFIIGYAKDGITVVNAHDFTWRVIPLHYALITPYYPPFTWYDIETIWLDDETILFPNTNLPDGEFEVGYSDLQQDINSTFTVWQINMNEPTAQPIQTFRGFTPSVRISPNGKYLVYNQPAIASSSQGKVHLAKDPYQPPHGSNPPPMDLIVAELQTGAKITILNQVYDFIWLPGFDLFAYDQVALSQDDKGSNVETYLGQIGKESIRVEAANSSGSLYLGSYHPGKDRLILTKNCDVFDVKLGLSD